MTQMQIKFKLWLEFRISEALYGASILAIMQAIAMHFNYILNAAIFSVFQVLFYYFIVFGIFFSVFFSYGQWYFLLNIIELLTL